MGGEKRQIMMKEDKRPVSLSMKERVANKKDGKKSWKLLKERLKQHKSKHGSQWTSTIPVPASDVPLNLSNSNRYSARAPNAESDAVPNLRTMSVLQRNSTRTISRGSPSARFDDSIPDKDDAVEDHKSEEEEDEEDDESDEDGGGEKKVRMSLMALLAETDREMGIDGSSYMMGDDDDDDYDDEDDDDGVNESEEEMMSNCCVCKVRHKGSASTPCGHTFCRLCSKEVNVQKGNCSLCNNFILEILDIF